MKLPTWLMTPKLRWRAVLITSLFVLTFWVLIAGWKAMRTDALFWIASQSKPMTAAAFMMLAFLIGHLYLSTTGHTPLAHIKAMITGYEDVEDEPGEKSE